MHKIILATAGIIVATASFEVAAQQPARPLETPHGALARLGLPSGSQIPPDSIRRRLLPGTRLDVFAKIRGNALTYTDAALPEASVRLRDARLGRILDKQISDRAGLFEFGSLDPGLYIVEIVGQDQSILAASQLLSVTAGEAVSAVVKLPFGVPPLGGLLGHDAQTAGAVAAAAANAGILAAKVTTQITPQ